MLVQNRTLKSKSASGAGSLDLQNLKDRIKLVAGLQGGNSALARSIDGAESTVRKWIKGESEPKYNSLVAIANATGISLEWLMSGDGEMRVQSTNSAISDPIVEKMERTEQSMVIVGWDNMEPTLYTGDEIGIEFVEMTPCEATSGIYLVRMGNTEGIWRLQPTVDRKMWLLNDNPKYQRGDTLIDLNEAHDIKIDAKVLWVRHKL